MPQHISKKGKRKYGLMPGYIPKMLHEATETANIPIIQRDGSVRYVSQDDFNWLVSNRMSDPKAVVPSEEKE